MEKQGYSFVEVMQRLRDILDSLGRTDSVCAGVKCKNCPLASPIDLTCCMNTRYLFDNPAEFEKLVMDYEPKVDWTKVEIDTPIWVRGTEDGNWVPRYFARCENGIVYAYTVGTTSFTSSGQTSGWRYAKLADRQN